MPDPKERLLLTRRDFIAATCGALATLGVGAMGYALNSLPPPAAEPTPPLAANPLTTPTRAQARQSFGERTQVPSRDREFTSEEVELGIRVLNGTASIFNPHGFFPDLSSKLIRNPGPVTRAWKDKFTDLALSPEQYGGASGPLIMIREPGGVISYNWSFGEFGTSRSLRAEYSVENGNPVGPMQFDIVTALEDWRGPYNKSIQDIFDHWEDPRKSVSPQAASVELGDGRKVQIEIGKSNHKLFARSRGTFVGYPTIIHAVTIVNT